MFTGYLRWWGAPQWALLIGPAVLVVAWAIVRVMAWKTKGKEKPID